MGTATMQESLWRERVQDDAEIVEPCSRPLYEAVFDATEASLKVARERTPGGDFRVGEMEELPWPDNTFDVVTGFNAFQYAADVVNALQEDRQVARPGGRVVMAVLGRPEDCEIAVLVAALSAFLPPGVPGPFALSAPGRVEGLLEQAGLAPLTSGEVNCPFEFPDLERAVRGNTAAGPAAAAIRQAGVDAVQRAIADALAPFRTSTGGYRLHNRLRYVLAAV